MPLVPFSIEGHVISVWFPNNGIFLSTYYVPGTVAGDKAGDETEDNTCLYGALILVWGDRKYVNFISIDQIITVNIY